MQPLSYQKSSAHFNFGETPVKKLFDVQQQEWALWEQKEQAQDEQKRSLALRTRNIISRWRWQTINSARLDSMFSLEQNVKFSPERLILFLPPFPSDQREFVPVMSLNYEPSKECIEIRVGMYTLQENGTPCGFAFRLESPTSICKQTGQESIHDFYHVQFMKELEKHAPELHMPAWLPEYQPSICIRASNPVEAILSLVLSLYGLEYFKKFLQGVKSQIRQSDISWFVEWVK